MVTSENTRANLCNMHPVTLPITSKSFAKWTPTPMPTPSSLNDNIPTNIVNLGCISRVLDLNKRKGMMISLCCASRRQFRYQSGDENGDDECGHNEDIAKLELYSQSARGEALLVRAAVDQQEVHVLIFKGLSSCLSYSTSPDPTRSILPARAVIKTIDRIKGPFNPANIEYLQKDVTWEEFRTRLLSN